MRAKTTRGSRGFRWRRGGDDDDDVSEKRMPSRTVEVSRHELHINSNAPAMIGVRTLRQQRNADADVSYGHFGSAAEVSRGS